MLCAKPCVCLYVSVYVYVRVYVYEYMYVFFPSVPMESWFQDSPIP